MATSDGEAEFVIARPRLDGQVVLVEPDPSWPTTYEGQARRIVSVLGPRVRALEHVGSTSVPGLAAKPIIDIVLLVDDPRDEASYVPDLERAGFLLHVREPGWHEHRFLKGTGPDVNLHVFADGSAEVDRMLSFRDRLRSNEEERTLYEAAKRGLAARQWGVVQDYADAKSEIVEAIIARAADERGQA